ncbi:glycosyltransferase [Streptomyces olivoreticuli]
MRAPNDSTAPRLSVVVPSRGPAARLRATLACLTGSGPGTPPFEVVVVDDNDDGGDDGRKLSLVAREMNDLLPLRVVRGPLRGRAAARNAGAVVALAPRLVFLDDDVLVGPGFLAAHAGAADPETFTHGRLRELPTAARFLVTVHGACPAEARRARARLEPSSSTVPERRPPHRRLVANALERAVEAMDGGSLPDVAPWLGFIGANTALDRTVWERTGGFDEEFGLAWGCEDLEFGFRLHAAGLRRTLAPEALGVHLSHARPGRWEQHHRNLTHFSTSHPHPSVRALEALLGPDGTPEGYVRAVLAEGVAPTPDTAR